MGALLTGVEEAGAGVGIRAVDGVEGVPVAVQARFGRLVAIVAQYRVGQLALEENGEEESEFEHFNMDSTYLCVQQALLGVGLVERGSLIGLVM